MYLNCWKNASISQFVSVFFCWEKDVSAARLWPNCTSWCLSYKWVMPWISRWKLGSKVIGSVGCITPIDPIYMYRLQPIYQKLLPSWDIQVGMFEYLFSISTRFQTKNSTKSPHVLSHLPWVLLNVSSCYSTWMIGEKKQATIKTGLILVGFS